MNAYDDDEVARTYHALVALRDQLADELECVQLALPEGTELTCAVPDLDSLAAATARYRSLSTCGFGDAAAAAANVDLPRNEFECVAVVVRLVLPGLAESDRVRRAFIEAMTMSATTSGAGAGAGADVAAVGDGRYVTMRLRVPLGYPDCAPLVPRCSLARCLPPLLALVSEHREAFVSAVYETAAALAGTPMVMQLCLCANDQLDGWCRAAADALFAARERREAAIAAEIAAAETHRQRVAEQARVAAEAARAKAEAERIAQERLLLVERSQGNTAAACRIRERLRRQQYYATLSAAEDAKARKEREANADYPPLLRRFNEQVQDVFDAGAEHFTFTNAFLPSAPLDSVASLHRSLKYLDLTGVGLASLPASLSACQLVEKLVLRKNHFREMPRVAFAFAATLRVLDMASNKLTEVPAELGGCTELRVLELSHNKIATMACNFGGLTKLEVLDVADNNLLGIAPEVGALKNLWQLRVRGNPMIDIPVAVYYKGIDAIKAYLSKSNASMLYVSTPTMRADAAYLHLRCIAGNEHLRETVCVSGVVLPVGYVPGGGDERDDFAAVVGDDEAWGALVDVTYTERTTEVSVDGATGATSVVERTSAEPKLLLRTFRWLLGARVPLLLVNEYGGLRATAAVRHQRDDSRDRRRDRRPTIHLPRPLFAVEALLFASFVLSPGSPYVAAKFGAATAGGCLALIEQFTRPGLRRTGLPPINAADGSAMESLPESMLHWAPVARCEDVPALVRAATAPLVVAAAAVAASPLNINNSSSGSGNVVVAAPPSGLLLTAAQHAQSALVAADVAREAAYRKALLKQNAFLEELARSDPDVVSFVVGPERVRFRGHKSLFALRCGFFRTMFLDRMVNTSEDIDLDDIDPSAFAALVTFLYTDSHGKKMTADNVVALLYLSAHYEVPRLRAMAEAMVGYHVEVENVCQILQMAFQLQSNKLKDACVMFVVANRFHVEATQEYEDLAPEVRAEISAKIATLKGKK